MCACVRVPVCGGRGLCRPKFIHICALMIVNNCRFTSNWTRSRHIHINININKMCLHVTEMMMTMSANCERTIIFFRLQCNLYFMNEWNWKISNSMGADRMAVHANYKVKCGKCTETKHAKNFCGTTTLPSIRMSERDGKGERVRRMILHSCTASRWNFLLITVIFIANANFSLRFIHDSHFALAPMYLVKSWCINASN